MGKTWWQKLYNGRDPKAVILAKPYCGVQAGSKLFVATPLLVKEFIEAIPGGESTTVSRMRDDLAAQWDADVTCPTSTGIFVRIVAEAALEDLANGAPENRITPFWRVVDETSPVVAKLSCGREFIRRKRESERLPRYSNKGTPLCIPPNSTKMVSTSASPPTSTRASITRRRMR